MVETKIEFYNIGVTDYKQIINAVQMGYGFDFSYYSPITFRRKIIELMELYKINDVDELKFLLENHQFDNDFFKVFHVPITEMFRDPAFWRKIILLVEDNKNPENKLRVCFPGCVIGNEIISFLIILNEMGVTSGFDIKVSNPFPMNVENLVMSIGKRQFELSKINFERLELKNTNLEKYFDRDNKGNYVFRYREMPYEITFVNHDFIDESMVTKQNMIFFRNQLLYFTSPVDRKIIENVSNSLRPKGYLFVGIKEKIENPEKYYLELVDETERFYQRK